METENQKEEKSSERLSAVVRSLQAREIKYRAWDVENKKMLPSYGVLAKIEFNPSNKPSKIGIYEYEQIDEEGNCDWNGFEVDEDKFILMQYTGLKDKNGKEIYEADLVYDELLEENVYVTWNNGKYCAGQNSLSYVASHCNVIGNVLELIE